MGLFEGLGALIQIAFEIGKAGGFMPPSCNDPRYTLQQRQEMINAYLQGKQLKEREDFARRMKKN